jgi:hypothetical protein
MAMERRPPNFVDLRYFNREPVACRRRRSIPGLVRLAQPFARNCRFRVHGPLAMTIADRSHLDVRLRVLPGT